MHRIIITEESYKKLFTIVYDIDDEKSAMLYIDNKNHNIPYSHLYQCSENDNAWKLLCNVSNKTAQYLEEYLFHKGYSWKSLYFDRIRRNSNIFYSYMMWLEWKHYLEKIQNQYKTICSEYIDAIRFQTLMVIKYDPNLGFSITRSYLQLIVENSEDNFLCQVYVFLSEVSKLGLSNPSPIVNNIINLLRDHTQKEQVYNILLESAYILCIYNFHYPCLYYLYKTFITEFKLKNGNEWMEHICAVFEKIDYKCNNPLIIYQILLYGLPISLRGEKKLESCNIYLKCNIYKHLDKARELQFARMI